MRGRSRRSSYAKKQPDINLNSFLDLILNILLFFVFATELAVFDSIDVAVPVTEYSDTTSSQNRTFIIFITKDNQYLVEGIKVAIEGLANTLIQKKKTDTTFTGVVVRGDLNSNLQALVDVLAACRLAGIENVKVETEKPSS
ncbi:MAG: biopolymer transporter ExbD [Methylotenera sp.]|uniref:ExbD/TolR family protein n=1 Tax=Methylotenera sp. TaxID=2051956 RepID=UPI0017FDEDD2|nr:biopolymer transporter ExbD [Methylotenera sp.]NOU24178.1 biopolymer transporter ExbD [Methylotenera sp.]